MPAWGAVAKTLWKKYGKEATLSLLKQIGLAPVLTRIEEKLGELGDRNRAVRKAKQTRDGRWAPVIVEGRTRYVVYSANQPIEMVPGIAGELVEAMETFDTNRLRSPDDVASEQFRRWALQRWKRLKREADGGDDSSVGSDEPENAAREALSRAHPAGSEAVFNAMVAELPGLLDQLTTGDGRPVALTKIPETPGVYFFTEGVAPIYVGQSRNLRRRLRQHTAKSSGENQATLAWRIALNSAKDSGRPVIGTRKSLEADETFAAHFSTAKERVASMDVRFIELDNPVTRTLFELYAARVLRTDDFNSWETH